MKERERDGSPRGGRRGEERWSRADWGRRFCWYNWREDKKAASAAITSWITTSISFHFTQPAPPCTATPSYKPSLVTQSNTTYIHTLLGPFSSRVSSSSCNPVQSSQVMSEPINQSRGFTSLPKYMSRLVDGKVRLKTMMEMKEGLD